MISNQWRFIKRPDRALASGLVSLALIASQASLADQAEPLSAPTYSVTQTTAAGATPHFPSL